MSGSRWRKFAPWGIYLSAVAFLVAFGLFVVQRAWTLPLQISLAGAVLGLAVFALLDPARVRSFFSGRRVRQGSNLLVVVSAFLGILVVLNYFVYQNTYRWDLTKGKQQSLAPETIETLKLLQEPVSVLAFYGAVTPNEHARELLDNYHYHSGGKFNYEFIDPETAPIKASQENITRDAMIVLRMGDRRELVTYADERELTGALIRLISPGERVVYFLTGHGEHDPTGVGDQAFSRVRLSLEAKNYSVLRLNLLASAEIPPDASAIVIAGPSEPLSGDEINLIARYLTDGGGLVVMEEPLPFTDYGLREDPLASYLDDVWGLTIGDDLIVDLSSNKPFTAVANQYGNHPITQKMQGLVTFFPDARSVSVGREVDGIGQEALVQTASQSWAETDLDAVARGAEIVPDEGTDRLGPVSLAVVAENYQTAGRVVVFGDSDFATDARFSAYGNGDLLLNAVDWAAEQDELISLTPKEQAPGLLVSPPPYVFNLIVFTLVFVLPGMVVMLGAAAWYRRRLSE